MQQLNPETVQEQCNKDVPEDTTALSPEAGPYRRALPQIIACSVKNLLMFDLGLALGISTIIIPILRGLQNDRFSNETLHFTAIESSWFGSLAFMTQPIGSIVSGWITEQIGRKRAMLIVNIPHIIAWAMLVWATSVLEIFVAGVLLGLGVGLMESPIMTYVGEISHKSIRGPLLALSNLSVMVGSLTMYLLGSLFAWRTCALISLFVPIVTVLLLLIVPESPYWLISQDRNNEAIASLQWLRGWVSTRAVQPEFDEISRYIEKANRCKKCTELDCSCEHSKRYIDKAKDLLRMKTIRPLILVSFVFFVVHSNANSAVRPFLVQVLQTFGVPMDPNWAVVVIGLMDFLSNFICIFAVKISGKRNLFLYSVGISCICCTSLATNAYLVIPVNETSFDSHLHNGIDQNNIFAMAMFVILALSCGISWCCAWMLVSEVFPFRVRGTASGIAAAMNYVAVFTVSKTYLSLETGLHIWGAFSLYAVLLFIGIIASYQVFPETEGRTLQEIESYFSDKHRPITSRYIKKIDQEHAVDRVQNISMDYDNKAYTA